MATEIFLQNEIFTRFAFPFLLVFFLIFAVLEKTGILGKDKHQLNALFAFVVGLVFVGFTYPTQIVGNMTLFLAVALVVVFVALLLWGFIMGGDSLNVFDKAPKGLKWTIGVVIVVAVILALLWAAGANSTLLEKLFNQEWSSKFWTNAAFVIVIVVALILAMAGGKAAKS